MPKFKDGYYPVRDCSICRSDIGYEIMEGKVYFNSNCDCCRYRVHLQPRSDEEFQKYLDELQGVNHPQEGSK